MTLTTSPTPALVRQQAPPARSALSALWWARRAARGAAPLLTTGTAPDQVRGRLCAALDRKRQDEVLRGHSETIGERLLRDLDALMVLPPAPYDACV